uniref:CSON000867 protein n=1 Tax=Culicoides sonorensis TaxID=179676 RepID=A0A336MJH4_CULSO
MCKESLIDNKFEAAIINTSQQTTDKEENVPILNEPQNCTLVSVKKMNWYTTTIEDDIKHLFNSVDKKSEGFELVGKQDKICQADGAWTPKELPTCVHTKEDKIDGFANINQPAISTNDEHNT